MKTLKHSYPLRINKALWDAVAVSAKAAGAKSINCALEEMLELGISLYCRDKAIPLPKLPVPVEQASLEEGLESESKDK